MTGKDYIREYANRFKYKEVLYHGSNEKQIYLKDVNEGFIVIESLDNSKYVNFYFNGKVKKFKKSDLVVCSLENQPAAWEAEND